MLSRDALMPFLRCGYVTTAELTALEEVDAALVTGDLDEAFEIATDSYEEGVRHPLVMACIALERGFSGDSAGMDHWLKRAGRELAHRGMGRVSKNARSQIMRFVVQALRPAQRTGVNRGKSGRGGQAASRSVPAKAARTPARKAATRKGPSKAARAASRRAEPEPEPEAAPPKPVAPPPGPPELCARVNWLPEAVPEVLPVPIDIQIDTGHALERLRAAQSDTLEQVRLARASVDIQRTGQFDNLLALAHTRDVEHFPHQVETARRVLRDMRGSALLADEVGLGKTVEAGLIIKEAMLRGLVRSVLVLCPPSLVEQWRGEMEAKFGLAFATPNGDAETFFASGNLLLCSYTLARRREHAERARARRFDLVVVDEAHHIKNRDTLGFKLVDGLHRRSLLLLTATPVQNHLDELYNLVTLLRPGYLGTRGAFARRFVTRGDPRQPQDRDNLRELLGEVMIRNTRALVDIRLPPRFVRTLAVEPAAAERSFYLAISDYVRGRSAQDPGRQRPLLLTLLAEAGSSPAAVFSTLEAQLAGGSLSAEQEQAARDLQRACVAVGETSKDRVLLELLAEAKGDKTVVFVKYRATLAALEGLLRGKGLTPAVFHGGMSAQEKDAAITAFRDELPVLLSTEVGGEGRNLQFCRRMVNFDLPWNPFAIEQRIGRLHRIGQSRDVHVANLCARGTAEDYLLTVLDEKLNMFELVVGELDMILGELDNEVDISGRVYSIWSGAKDEDALRVGFDQLGDDLMAARDRYREGQQVDAAIFGRDFEAA